MNSSISSSEPPSASAASSVAPERWREFVGAALVTAGVAALGLLAVAFLLDPYDTGRSPLPLKDGVRVQGPRTAAASRGRDPAFQAAIFGNSHIQLVSPEMLAASTGVPFVSLIAPATGPKETLVLIDWFLRTRKQSPRAIVVGIDSTWCTADPALPTEKPFPFWLFDRSLAEYLVGLFSLNVIEELPGRIAFLVSNDAVRARRDGYWDYEPDYRAQGYGRDPAILARLEERRETGGGNATGSFPAAAALEAMMEQAPPQMALIMVRPPVYATALPLSGSADAAADAACAKGFADLAAARPRTVLIDWRVDRPETRDPNQFFDHTHYRQPIARLVEADIAAALRALDR